jgi:hypothetical protein
MGLLGQDVIRGRLDDSGAYDEPDPAPSPAGVDGPDSGDDDE